MTAKAAEIQVRSSEPGAIPRLALATICGVLFLTFLDNTVVSVTLADVQSDLHAGVSELQWVVDGYALVFASFLLAGGALGDILGRKKVMLAGVATFCAGSVVGALAPTPSVLIAGRVIMGMGAAASEPGTLSMIRHLVPDRQVRAQALGAWAAVSGLALAMGPVIGGGLVALSGWRAVFWFNLLLGLVAFVGAAVTLPESADPQGRSIDLPGIVLGVLALGAVIYAVIEGENLGYRDRRIITLFVVSAVAAVAFVVVERHRRDPLLELSFFRIPAFTGANVIAFLTYFGVFSIFFFTALYLQVVGTSSPGGVALQFLPMTVVMVLASAFTGRWVARSGPRIPMVVGTALAGGGILLSDAVLNPTVSYAPMAGALLLVGLGFGIALVPVTSTVLSLVPPERSGMAASTSNTSRQLGAVVGVAVLGAVVNAQLTGSLKDRLHAIGIPAQFQSIVLQGVTHGAASSQGAAASKANPALTAIIDKVINAAYAAFGDGLDVALRLSGAMLLVGTLIALVTLRRTGPASATDGGPTAESSSSSSRPDREGSAEAFTPHAP